MPGKAIPGTSDPAYAALVETFPPRRIHTEDDLAATWEQIDRLMSRKEPLTPAETDYLGLLSDLVASWEDEHEDYDPQASPMDVIRLLLEDRGLHQKDLAAIFGTESIVSEVLSGKRQLQTKHIAGLSAFFGVSPALFFPSTACEPAVELACEASKQRGARLHVAGKG